MRLLICGSRTWTAHEPIYNELKKFDPLTTTIIHGGADGADRIANYLATALHFKVEVYPVTREEWARLGRPAGPLRNEKMVKTLNKTTDRVIAFHKNNSNGTASTIKFAEDRGIIVKVIKG